MFENEVIDRYVHCILQNLKKNAQVSMYSLVDLNIGHCVEFTFLEGKLGWFLIHVKSFLIRSFLKLLHFESESRFNSDEIVFSL